MTENGSEDDLPLPGAPAEAGATPGGRCHALRYSPYTLKLRTDHV